MHKFYQLVIYLLFNRIVGIKYVSGSVEAACGLGLADAVVDLVETGTTMKVRVTVAVCLKLNINTTHYT